MFGLIAFDYTIDDFSDFLKKKAREDDFEAFEEWLVDGWAEYQNKCDEARRYRFK